MKKTFAWFFVAISLAAICFLPLLGSYLKWKGFAPGYGDFPARLVMQPPGFNLTYFMVCAFIALIIALFLLFPKWFGFKYSKKDTPSGLNPKIVSMVVIPVIVITAVVIIFKMSYIYIPVTFIIAWLYLLSVHDFSPHKGDKKYKLPIWAKASIPVFILSWIAMWGRVNFIVPLEYFSFVPLWWSFIFILDGIVYVQNDGRSIISEKPKLMQIIALISCFCWFLFEYINFFVMENWYYPNDKILTNFGNIFWYAFSFTTVFPTIFEVYNLLLTFPIFKRRYAKGPKISIPKWAIVLIYITGMVLSFFMGYFPYQLFWMLWVCLIPALAAALSLVGYKTPFSYLREGNWTQINLIAIATLINGFFWEFWNYGSLWFQKGAPKNPNFWKYSVPYVDKGHFFSEMPILGYWGYLFFGVNCLILWFVAAYLSGFSPDFEADGRK